MLRDIFVATCMAIGALTISLVGAWLTVCLAMWITQEVRAHRLNKRIDAGYEHLLDDLVNGASDE